MLCCVSQLNFLSSEKLFSTHNSHFIFHYWITPKMDDLSFQYQTVDGLYTLYKHQIFGHTMDEAGLVFIQLKRVVQHISENKIVAKLPSMSEKRLSRKKFKRNLLRAEQRNASTQTLRSSFFDRIQNLKNSKYESELIKTVDCLVDGHRIIDNPML